MSTDDQHDKKRATRLVHNAYTPPAGFGGLNTAVHHASTVTFENVAAMRSRNWKHDTGYTYGLHGTPTTFTLAKRIAELEGGREAVLAPSGLAAIMLVDFALLVAGDEMLLPDNVYNPSRELATTMLADFGVTTRFYDPMRGAAIGALINDRTRLVWIETPGSVTMEMPDVAAIAAAAKTKNVLTAIDNTWAGGLLFCPFDHGVDIVMHALTKYPSGSSDVLMGSVTTRDESLHSRIKTAHMRLGLGIGGDDAYLMLRSLATLELRLAQSGATALALAQWLAARPEVARVLHPAFEESPGHAIWKRDFSGASGLFSVVLEKQIAETRVDAMVDSLKLFRIGYSWGGVHSLAVPYRVGSVGSAGGPPRTAAPWPALGTLVRFYAGLEHPDDLIADLEQAFKCLG